MLKSIMHQEAVNMKPGNPDYGKCWWLQVSSVAGSWVTFFPAKPTRKQIRKFLKLIPSYDR